MGKEKVSASYCTRIGESAAAPSRKATRAGSTRATKNFIPAST